MTDDELTGDDRRLADLLAAIDNPGLPENPATPGWLGELGAWLATLQGRTPALPPRRARLLLLAGTVPERTAQVAAGVEVGVRAVPRAGAGLPGSISREEALAALLTGAALADEEVDAGTDLLLLALPGPDLAVPGAALIGLLTRSDASAVTATGQDDAAWMLACAATRDLMRHARPQLGHQVELLAAVGGVELATATGVLLGAAARRTPVLLDGPISTAAAVVAARLNYRANRWWQAGTLSPDPAHRLALARMSMEPVLDLGLRSNDGTGALLAVPVLRAAVA